MVQRNPQSIRLKQVSDVLHHAYEHGGGTVLVDGQSGMGKTFLLRTFAQQTRKHGTWPLTYVNVDQIESGEPYSFIERFLASGIALDWDFHPEENHQPLALARQCVRRILDFAAGSGIIIMIDDIQWIDAESIKVLRHMVPRLNRRNVLFICAALSPHEPGSLAELFAETAAMNPGNDHHLTLNPLTNDEVRELARAQFEINISQHHAEQLLEATGGSFLGIDTIFGQISAEEMQQLHTNWELPIRPGRIRNPLLGAYEQLSPAAQQLVQIVCVAGHEISHETLQTAGKALGVPCKLDEALASNVIKESGFGHRIIPYHSQTAAAVRSQIDPAFARKISATLAELTTGFRSIRHRLLGAESWSEQLEDQVTEFVEEATELKQFPNVTHVLRKVLEFLNTPEQRQPWIIELALTSIRDKKGYECLDLLPEIEKFPPSMLREFIVVMLSLHRVNEPFPRERVDRILRDTATTPDEAVLQSFTAFMMAMLTMRTDDRSPLAQLIPLAKAYLTAGPQDPQELEDQRLTWMFSPQEHILLLECYELVQLHLNDATDEAREVLPNLIHRVRILPDAAVKIDCLTPLAGALMATGDVEQARDLAQEAVRLFEEVPDDPWTGGTPRIILAHCLVLLGDYTQAKEVLDHFEEISYEVLDLESRLTGTALRAKIAIITGTQDPAPYFSFADKLNTLWWEFYGRDLMYLAQAQFARSQDDDPKVLQITADPQLSNMRNHQRGTLTYRVHALLNLGELETATALISELQGRRNHSWYEYYGTLAWAQARHAELTGDTTAARTYYKAALEQRQFPLPWSLTALDYGQWLASNNHPGEAKHLLERAIHQLKELGAAAYIPKAHRILERVVEKQEHSKVHVWATMTPREFEVAGLLAKGLSNREIAQQLVVSEATARFHVSNILRKLQVSSRAEVPAIFQQSAMQEPTRNNSKN